MEKRPIFLHGMWRSGSTYIWSRFRAADAAYCYYEPLNHGLGRLTPERIGRDTPEITAANAHPVLSRPYFAEFEPLIKGRGVAGFRPRFSYKRFVLEKDDADEPLRAYIRSLINYAAAQGKTPVLGFNATDLRIGWMNERFHPFSIYIKRDPRRIWESYEAQRQNGNNTFFFAWLNIIEHNAAHPAFAPLAEKLPLRRGLRKFTVKPKKFYAAALNDMTQEQTYEMVEYVWRLSVAQGEKNCDLVIDVDRGADESYKKSLNDKIRQACGLDISFADMRAPGKTDPFTLLRAASAPD